MIRLIVRRLLISIPLLLAVSMLTFVLVNLSPGDAAYTVLGARATPEQLAAMRAQMGLDKPLWSQYATWLAGAVRGDLGRSLITGQPVRQAVAQQLGPTLSLVALTAVVAAALGVGLGIWSAVRGGWRARVADAVSFTGIAVPNFVLALVLLPVFAVSLGWLPASGYTPLAAGLGSWLRFLVLPVAALAFGSVGIIAKQTRTALEDVLARDFITVLRANGYRTGSIIFKHALKAAAMPIIAIIGVVFVSFLSGTVLIEAIFAVPGLGGLALSGSAQSDLPVVLGVTVVFTVAVVAVNLVLDICYAAVDPKVGLR